MAISFTSVHFISVPSFLDHVDGVLGDFHDKIRIRHPGLAREARLRFQAPGLVEQVVFFFFRWLQRVEALAHDDVAGGAGAGLFAGVSISMPLLSRVSQMVSPGLASITAPSGHSSTWGSTMSWGMFCLRWSASGGLPVAGQGLQHAVPQGNAGIDCSNGGGLGLRHLSASLPHSALSRRSDSGAEILVR